MLRKDILFLQENKVMGIFKLKFFYNFTVFPLSYQNISVYFGNHFLITYKYYHLFKYS